MKNKRKNLIDKQYKGSESSNEIIKFLKIAIGVLLVLAIVYFGFGFITGEFKFKEEKKKEAVIQYSEILAESTFKQSENDYYVLYYDFKEETSTLIEAISGDLSQKGTIYKVDLSKGFNKNYISKNGKPKATPKDAEELTVVDPTLIEIKNKKVVKFITGKNNIKNYVTNLK